jgi:hypothetical protein
LFVDEMALQEGVCFDKSTMQVHGFVDLGTASPPDADRTVGDHALCFIFQPYQGSWFQAIGAFCSKGAAKGPELEKLITEAVILLERHKYFVDSVTTDGGSWNRNMWTQFGISPENVGCKNPAESSHEDSSNTPKGSQEGGNNDWTLFGLSPDNVSCRNPVEGGHKSDHNERKLWFFSDFPHLVKAIWSRIRKSQKLEVLALTFGNIIF